MMRITTFVVVFAAAVTASPTAAAPPRSSAEAPAPRTRSAVQATLRQALPAVLACGPSIDDTVTARFRVSASGTVSGVRITGPHARGPVGACMKKELRALRFTAAARSTPVTYPFRFGATAAAQAPTPGKLGKKELDGLLTMLEDDLKKCGEGDVRASFTVQKNGKPGDVKVADASDDKTQDCVTRRIARVRFPAAGKSTAVSRTFSLGADEG